MPCPSITSSWRCQRPSCGTLAPFSPQTTYWCACHPSPDGIISIGDVRGETIRCPVFCLTWRVDNLAPSSDPSTLPHNVHALCTHYIRGLTTLSVWSTILFPRLEQFFSHLNAKSLNCCTWFCALYFLVNCFTKSQHSTTKMLPGEQGSYVTLNKTCIHCTTMAILKEEKSPAPFIRWTCRKWCNSQVALIL